MRSLAIVLLFAGRALMAAEIESAVVEQTGPFSYTIDFQAPPEAFPVAIFASSKPDQNDSVAPVATITRVPAQISVPGTIGRVYFYLKPKLGSVRVVSIRRLPLEGATNFRDLGGYRSSDGRYVRWGLMYRSGQLSALTANDYKYLAGLGLRLVCDLRIDAERGRAPTQWQGDGLPEILISPVDTITYFRPGVSQQEHMRNVYNRMPFDGIAEFGNILHRFAKGDLPALVHCTAGKDRTGLFTALLLTALGVPRETVREDFALTNRYLVPDDKIPQLAKDLQNRLKLDSLPGAETVRVMNGVDPANLDTAFRVITEKYGSFDLYIRDGLKVTDAELKALRDRLLDGPGIGVIAQAVTQ